MKAKRDFQIFVKPVGALCNLDCTYCYYLPKQKLYRQINPMPKDLLETYIKQHIEAYPEPVIQFSWHGGEPTLPGIDYYQNIIQIQQKYCPADKKIVNGMQTNATLIDEEWADFLAQNRFIVGISMDGPPDLHDMHRQGRNNTPTHAKTLRGFRLLQEKGINPEVLCVVNSNNVIHPLEVYRYFRDLGTEYMTFLPMVAHRSSKVDDLSVSAEAFGNFLCTLFDEWIGNDIGNIKVQIFEEAARTAFKQEHSLCIFRETCGDIMVIEHNGDFYSCDHFVNSDYLQGNIMQNHLAEILESPAQRKFGQNKLESLPSYCLQCEVRDMCNGGCPKNRFISTLHGEPGLNYLCAGYKQFFTYCRPFVEQVARVWQQQNSGLSNLKSQSKTPGRNDPCPCGSGKKYKKCCMKQAG